MPVPDFEGDTHAITHHDPLAEAQARFVELSAEIHRLRAMVGRLQRLAAKEVSHTLSVRIRLGDDYEVARAKAFVRHGLHPGDLDRLEDA